MDHCKIEMQNASVIQEGILKISRVFSFYYFMLHWIIRSERYKYFL